jgi:hypothetical protein
MTRMGLPVPPGFTISTKACQAYLVSGREPAAMAAQVDRHLAALEATIGRQLGQPDHPLLVSVRSGRGSPLPVVPKIASTWSVSTSRTATGSRSGDQRNDTGPRCRTSRLNTRAMRSNSSILGVESGSRPRCPGPQTLSPINKGLWVELRGTVANAPPRITEPDANGHFPSASDVPCRPVPF